MPSTSVLEKQNRKVKAKDMVRRDAVPVLEKMLKKSVKGGRKRRQRALELAITALGGPSKKSMELGLDED